MKNIRHYIKMALGIMFIAGMTLQGVSAEDVIPESLEASSDVDVTFTAPDTTAPVDPVDPVDPEDGTGATGPLTIDYVSAFRFGSNSINGPTYTINSTSKKHNIQVSDRRATGAGWSIRATLSELTNTTDNHVIKSAKLSLLNGTIFGAPNSAGEADPTVEQAIELTAGASSSSLVTTSPIKSGMGTWLTKWDILEGELPEVKLEIDDDTLTVGDYEGTIDWVLTEAP